MHYLVLLYGDETGAAEPGTAEFDAEMAGYEAFGELAADAIRGGAALQLVDSARHVRHDHREDVASREAVSRLESKAPRPITPVMPGRHQPVEPMGS